MRITVQLLTAKCIDLDNLSLFQRVATMQKSVWDLTAEELAAAGRAAAMEARDKAKRAGLSIMGMSEGTLAIEMPDGGIVKLEKPQSQVRPSRSEPT
jgi:hypothetical protein